jgi:hypothetical protein
MNLTQFDSTLDFISVAFTIKGTKELFLTTIKAPTFQHALHEAITQYGLFVPKPEQYLFDYSRDDFIEFCKTTCNIAELRFNRLTIHGFSTK